MVDTQIPVSLALFHDSIGVVTTGDEPTGIANKPEQNLSHKSRGTLTRSGLDLETNPALRSEAEFFS
jgi:hypothetical protein